MWASFQDASRYRKLREKNDPRPGIAVLASRLMENDRTALIERWWKCVIVSSIHSVDAALQFHSRRNIIPINISLDQLRMDIDLLLEMAAKNWNSRLASWNLEYLNEENFKMIGVAFSGTTDLYNCNICILFDRRRVSFKAGILLSFLSSQLRTNFNLAL